MITATSWIFICIKNDRYNRRAPISICSGVVDEQNGVQILEAPAEMTAHRSLYRGKRSVCTCCAQDTVIGSLGIDAERFVEFDELSQAGANPEGAPLVDVEDIFPGNVNALNLHIQIVGVGIA